MRLIARNYGTSSPGDDHVFDIIHCYFKRNVNIHYRQVLILNLCERIIHIIVVTHGTVNLTVP